MSLQSPRPYVIPGTVANARLTAGSQETAPDHGLPGLTLLRAASLFAAL